MALRATRLAPFRAALSLRRPQASGFTPYHGGRPASQGGEEWRGCPEGSFQRPRPLGRGTGFTIPLAMGILNVTPASFSDGGMFLDPAGAARAAGVSIVNDVPALRGDPDMARVAARRGAAVILMHMQGTPRTMQRRPRYQDVVEDVSGFLVSAAERARAAGIPRSRILIDPGLGFGKTVAHNLALLRELDRFVSLGYPVVLGPSRKSFIGASAGGEAHERLGGTLAAVAAARMSGVHIVRVHDVQPTVKFLRMLEAIEKA